MKKIIFNKLFFAIAFIMFAVACENRELVTVENANAPSIVDLSKETLVLDGNYPKNPALTVTWSPATYTVPTEVNYKLEISADEPFTKPIQLSTLTKSERNMTFTTEQMNTAAAAIGLVSGTPGKMYLRVKGYVGHDALSSVSKVTSIMVTPYELSYPDFFLVGNASYVDWQAANAQILYKKDNFSYIYTYLEKDKNFRFLGQQGWDGINYSINADGIRDNYKYFKQVSSNITKSNDTDGENMTFHGETGIYKVTIDASTGVQSLTAAASSIPQYDITNLYIVGTVDGNGWSAANAIPMTKVAAGEFTYTTTLAADTAFKLIGQKDFGDLEWGNILSNNKGYSGFLGPKGDNSDIIFVGDGGSYKIRVNLKAGTISIKK